MSDMRNLDDADTLERERVTRGEVGENDTDKDDLELDDENTEESDL